MALLYQIALKQLLIMSLFFITLSETTFFHQETYTSCENINYYKWFEISKHFLKEIYLIKNNINIYLFILVLKKKKGILIFNIQCKGNVFQSDITEHVIWPDLIDG